MPRKVLDNLGKRQEALNAKVNQAVDNEVNFNDIKDATETSELDKLFKIDVAAIYENTDYIIEVLKSGESLYITRALNKCLWLYEDYYGYIINPEFLHQEVFPYMSNHMKKKLLTAVAKHVRTEDRAAEFYHYCIDKKLITNAFKFLLFTSEELKLDMMLHHNEAPFNEIKNKKQIYVQQFIGTSFTLLEEFLNIVPENRRHDVLLQFKFMYWNSNEAYLNLFEKFKIIRHNNNRRFDLKLSNDIMTKHKSIVLANPSFFVTTINDEALVRHTTVDDAKSFAAGLLPEQCTDFWAMHFYDKYEYFLKKIPNGEAYCFIKQIFHAHYKRSDFEMTDDFYIQKYYRIMTQHQKEEWALRQLNSEKQVLGVGCDFKWYEFINFAKSFEEIKKMIVVTTITWKRLDMLEVLVKAAKNNRELETLFNYFYKRHSNESRQNLIAFLRSVFDYQNVFKFDESCWAEFYKILLNMELYNDYYNESNEAYKSAALLYYILHGLEINDHLTKFLLHDFDASCIYSHYNKLDGDNREIVYNYLHKYFINQVELLKDQIFTTEESTKAQRYYKNITDLMSLFRKEVPEVKKVHNQPRKKRNVDPDPDLSDRELIRRLKKDAELIKQVVTLLKEFLIYRPFKMIHFLKKIKIYFSDEIAEIYLEIFENIITQSYEKMNSNCRYYVRAVELAVFGICQLASEEKKIHFMKEHSLQNLKVNQQMGNFAEVCIQKSICRFACTSHPPVPLDSMRPYLLGDFLEYSVNTFDKYCAHLPMPLCVQMTETLINTPVSTMKHIIRLAFKCFDSEKLKTSIVNIWNNTKNVTIRGIIYKSLYKKLKTDGDDELLDAMKTFTSTLHQDDDEEIFGLFRDGVLPDQYRGQHDEALWRTVSNFKNIQPQINRKIDIITRMHIDMYLLNEEFVRTIVDEHINSMLNEKQLYLMYSAEDMSRLCVVKWQLTARYIIHYANFANGSIDKYSQVAKDIFEKCIEFWNEDYNNIKHFQRLCADFVGYLKEESYVIWYEVQNYETVIPVFEIILNTLKHRLPLHQFYMLMWDLRLTILNRREIQVEKDKLSDSNRWEIIVKTATSFGREIGKLVIELIENKTYLSTFVPDIKEVIISSARYLLFCLNKFDVKDLDKVLIFVASGLIEHEVPETYILAIKLLPNANSSEFLSDLYKAVLEKINSFTDLEVQSVMCDVIKRYT